MHVLIYEEYDGSIHGNQKYIGMLLKDWGRAGRPDAPRLTLIVPRRRELYEHTRELGEVHCLQRPHWWTRPAALIPRLRRVQPDVVLALNERSLLTVLPAVKLAGCPLVWYVKNTHVCWWSDRIGFWSANRVLANAPQNIEAKGASLYRRWQRTDGVLRSGAIFDDLAGIAPVVPPSGPLQVLLVANICPAKGIDKAMAAMEAADSRRLGIHLRIVGATPPKHAAFAETMKRRAAALKHVRVEWLGWRKDVPALIEWSQVVILPSQSEGVPRSLIEAMAAGRAVIGTAVGGTPFLIQDEQNGFLVGADDVGALLDRIAQLDDDRDLIPKLGEAGRAHVMQHHSWPSHINELERHLRSVCCKHTGNRASSLANDQRRAA